MFTRLFLSFLMAYGVTSYAGLLSDADLESHFAGLQRCESKLTHSWPKLNPLTLWFFELDHSNKGRRDFRALKEEFKAADVEIGSMFPPQNDNSWFVAGTTNNLKGLDLKK